MENTYDEKKKSGKLLIVHFILWLIANVGSFLSMMAFLQIVSRIYGAYAINGYDLHSYMGGVSLRQFMVLPAGLLTMVTFIAGTEAIYRYGRTDPGRVWRFYSIIFGIEFAILFLALKI
ncbi:MAG: hypothetical protein K8R40_03375 [Anaerolineaceae bacterium]|nr:hypothetical protein [Anaerolineaceae bacterium]